VLQLDRRDRQTVQEQDEIDRMVFTRNEPHLPHDNQTILPVSLCGVRVEGSGRREVGEADGPAIELQAVTQELQRADSAAELLERLQGCGLELTTMLLFELGPELRLCVLDEGDDVRGVECAAAIVVSGTACYPSALDQCCFDGGLESVFGVN